MRELLRLGIVAGGGAVEPLPAVLLLGAVVIIGFRLSAGIAEGRREGEEELLPLGVLEFEIDLHVVVRREVLVLGIRIDIAAALLEGQPLRPAARILERMVVVGRCRTLQPLNARGIVVGASLGVGLDAAGTAAKVYPRVVA